MSAFLELIDQQGLPLQSWPLSGDVPLQIGRAEGADILISNPFVSRAHAYIQPRNNGWEVVGLSDKGLYAGGERVATLALVDGVEFRLAAKGPVLRMRVEESREETEQPSSAGLATISFDESTMPVLVLDQRQRDREVQEIIEDDYFRNVQNIAAALRKRKSTQS